MSWIRVDFLMPSHPKLGPLTEALNVPQSQAVGLLVSVWTYCSMYHGDGQTSGISNSHLTTYLAGFDACKLTDAMRATGWIDADGRLHDWDDYQGIEIGRREKNRNYMREYRLREKAQPKSTKKDLRKAPRNGLRKGATYERTNEQTTRAREERGASRRAGPEGPRARPAQQKLEVLPIAETMARLRADLKPEPPQPNGSEPHAGPDPQDG